MEFSDASNAVLEQVQSFFVAILFVGNSAVQTDRTFTELHRVAGVVEIGQGVCLVGASSSGHIVHPECCLHYTLAACVHEQNRAIGEKHHQQRSIVVVADEVLGPVNGPEGDISFFQTVLTQKVSERGAILGDRLRWLNILRRLLVDQQPPDIVSGHVLKLWCVQVDGELGHGCDRPRFIAAGNRICECRTVPQLLLKYFFL